MSDSGMRAKPPDELGTPPWLKQIHMEAADDLTALLLRVDPEWDAADLHEDMRETLQIHFDKLADLVHRHKSLRASHERLAHALKDILDVAEREIAGFPIDREEWYARRDYARIQLEDSGV